MALTKRVVLIIIVVLVSLLLIAGCKKTAGDDKAKAPSDQKKTTKPKAPEPKEPDPKEPDAPAEKPSGPPTLADVAGYKEWLKMNSKPVQGRTHGLANIYVNQTRKEIAPDGKLSFPFPDGTVIVKEVLSSDFVAIMRKVKGADPDHNDWQWIEYRSSGAEVGKDAECWACHSGAKDRDYVFTKLDTP